MTEVEEDWGYLERWYQGPPVTCCQYSVEAKYLPAMAKARGAKGESLLDKIVGFFLIDVDDNNELTCILCSGKSHTQSHGREGAVHWTTFKFSTSTPPFSLHPTSISTMSVVWLLRPRGSPANDSTTHPPQSVPSIPPSVPLLLTASIAVWSILPRGSGPLRLCLCSLGLGRLSEPETHSLFSADPCSPWPATSPPTFDIFTLIGTC